MLLVSSHFKIVMKVVDNKFDVVVSF